MASAENPSYQRWSAWTRATVQFAAQQQVADAKRALQSPYLVPGDREVLRLRISHPNLSAGELAQLAGMSRAALGAKLRGAMRRGPRSVLGTRVPDEDRYVPAGKAARRLGVTPADLRVMARRGTVTARRTHQGSFEYRAGDLDRVRQMLGETVTAIADQMHDMPS